MEISNKLNKYLIMKIENRDKKDRDILIVQAGTNGLKYEIIAKMFDISIARVSQIINKNIDKKLNKS